MNDTLCGGVGAGDEMFDLGGEVTAGPHERVGHRGGGGMEVAAGAAEGPLGGGTRRGDDQKIQPFFHLRQTGGGKEE